MKQADYSKLLDDEIRAFIAETDSHYPPDAVDHSIAEQRRVYDRMCRAFFAGYPDGISARDSTIESAAGHPVPLRSYARAGQPAAAAVLYLHGGGFVVGGLDSHDDVCAEICDRTGFDVVSVDYRLCPEHMHPAAFDDAMAGWRHLRAATDLPIVLAGDSAGGNLAAALAHATRGTRPPPVGQVLVYPGLGGDMDRGSYLIHADAPMLKRRDLVFYKDLRSGGRDLTGDASYAPLWDTDFRGLPPTFVASAECDPISDDGDTYARHIRAAGGRAVWLNDKGLVHGHLRARHRSRRAGQSFDRIVAAIDSLGRTGELP
ncbi:MAG: alpha/beta hydrolase [Minwuia sp.]|nr:alpha/beta hydrolase [Minwuia sp.]